MDDDDDIMTDMASAEAGGSLFDESDNRPSSSSKTAPDENEKETAAPSKDPSKKHFFLKELRCMMYGFGDDKVPYTETVELLEDIVVEYMQDMTKAAMDVGKPGRVTLEDIWYLIRRDPKKYGRVKDLLTMNEELKRARKAFDEAKY